jgi:hypothetical protein
MRLTAPGAESLVNRDSLSTVRARRSDWLTQNEVEKKSQQVRDEDCDQNPENRLHRAPTGICIDIPDAEQPGCYHAAEKYTHSGTAQHTERHSTVAEVVVVLNGRPKRSNQQPDKGPTDYKSKSADANCLWNNTQKTLDAHKVLSFRLAADNRGNIGKSSRRQIDGTIKNAKTPWRICML